MKTFREQLNWLNDNNIYVCDILIANACDSIFDFDYTDEEFETLCSIAVSLYLGFENVTEDEIAFALNKLRRAGVSIEDIAGMSKWEIHTVIQSGNYVYEDINEEEEEEDIELPF